LGKFCGIPDQALGIEKPQLFFGKAKRYLFCGHQLADQIDGNFLFAKHGAVFVKICQLDSGTAKVDSKSVL